jgi:hypothetical protein
MGILPSVRSQEGIAARGGERSRGPIVPYRLERRNLRNEGTIDRDHRQNITPAAPRLPSYIAKARRILLEQIASSETVAGFNRCTVCASDCLERDTA